MAAVEAGKIGPPGLEGSRTAASRVDCVDKKAGGVWGAGATTAADLTLSDPGGSGCSAVRTMLSPCASSQRGTGVLPLTGFHPDYANAPRLRRHPCARLKSSVAAPYLSAPGPILSRRQHICTVVRPERTRRCAAREVRPNWRRCCSCCVNTRWNPRSSSSTGRCTWTRRKSRDGGASCSTRSADAAPSSASRRARCRACRLSSRCGATRRSAAAPRHLHGHRPGGGKGARAHDARPAARAHPDEAGSPAGARRRGLSLASGQPVGGPRRCSERVEFLKPWIWSLTAYRLRHTLANQGCCSRGRPGGR